MTRIRSVVVLGAFAVLTFVAGAQAASVVRAPHAKGVPARATSHATVAANPACPVGDPAACGGACPMRATAAAAVATHPQRTMASGTVCPVSDPSQCPASCPRSAAVTAIAANTKR